MGDRLYKLLKLMTLLEIVENSSLFSYVCIFYMQLRLSNYYKVCISN